MKTEIVIVYDRNNGYGVAAGPNVNDALEVICWCHRPQDALQIKTLLSEQVALVSTDEQPEF